MQYFYNKFKYTCSLIFIYLHISYLLVNAGITRLIFVN